MRLAALSAIALPLAGCSGSSGPVSNVPNDTIRVAMPNLEPVLDPHTWATARGPRTFAPMFDALTFVQSDGQLRPALAISWSQPSATIWLFRLRASDAKFHNGELFGPDSVKLTFERLMNGGLPLSPVLANVAAVEVLDPATVRIDLQQPDADFARRVSAVYMLPAGYFSQVGSAGFAAQPIGTGFWMLDSYEPGRRLAFRNFRDTWRGARGADPPPIVNLQLDVMPDASSRVAALRDLQLDIAAALSQVDAAALPPAGFAVDSADLDKLSEQDAGWQRQALGAVLGQGTEWTGTAANLKGLTSLPNGSLWFDRVTKTAMQRVAVAGGA